MGSRHDAIVFGYFLVSVPELGKVFFRPMEINVLIGRVGSSFNAGLLSLHLTPRQKYLR